MSYIKPLRLAVMFDGDQNDIRSMAKDAVSQLAADLSRPGRGHLRRNADQQSRGTCLC